MRTSSYQSFMDVVSVKTNMNARQRAKGEKNPLFVTRDIQIISEHEGHRHIFELTLFASNSKKLKIINKKEGKNGDHS